jgi:hypothetical protein
LGNGAGIASTFEVSTVFVKVIALTSHFLGLFSSQPEQLRRGLCGPAAFPASHILKPCDRRQVNLYLPLVNLYLPLTDRTGRPGRRVGYGSSEWAYETENNDASSEEICG